MHESRTLHEDTVYRILRYLKSTPGRRILSARNWNLRLESCTDEDWAGLLIIEDQPRRKSKSMEE